MTRNEINKMQAEIKQLKKENAYLLKACEEQFTFNTIENKKYSIFNSVRKDFAERVKNKYGDYFCYTSLNNVKSVNEIVNEILKEYEK